MAFSKSVINSAVESAFKAAGELVKKAVLSGKEQPSFNWSSGTSNGVESTVEVEVIPYQTSTSRKFSDGALDALEHYFLIRSKDLPKNRYTTLTIGDLSYSIEEYDRYEGVAVIIGRANDV